MKKTQTRLALLTTAMLLIHQYSFAEVPKSMVALDEQQLAAQTGQSLFSLSYIAPTDSSNLMTGKTVNGASTGNVGFYKLGVDADVELNANIRNIQLGCGGINGIGSCDVDIKNLSLSGLPTSYDNSGNPIFANGRPATSAKLVNPFVQFAIRNPDTASTREIMGFRVSAEQIFGLLTTGLTNNDSPTTTDGIQSLSGFMRLASTTGTVTTQSTLFGRRANESIQGLLSAVGQKRTFTSQPSDPNTLGVTIPSMAAGFTMPQSIVNGKRLNYATVNDITSTIANLPLTTGTNQMAVTFPSILGLTKGVVILKSGSAINNLNLNVTFNQSLSMLHNIPLNGTGGYIALQGQPILWPGSYVDSSDSTKTELNQMAKTDVAQQGWWMSFADPIQLGKLNGTVPVDISATFAQVASLMTAELLKEENRVDVPIGDALGALFGASITTPNPVIVDLGPATTANPARLTLANVPLANQNVVSNCWGGVKFC